jgi:hypothetical protein
MNLSKVYESRENYRGIIPNLLGIFKGRVIQKSVLDKFLGIGVVAPFFNSYFSSFLFNFNDVDGIDGLEINLGNGDPVLSYTLASENGLSDVLEVGEGNFTITLTAFNSETPVETYSYDYSYYASFSPGFDCNYYIHSFEINGLTNQTGNATITSPVTMKIEGSGSITPSSIFWYFDSDDAIEISTPGNMYEVTKTLRKGYHYVLANNISEAVDSRFMFLNVT